MGAAVPRNIFEVISDFEQYAGQWFLDEPLTASGNELDAREFTVGTRYSGPLPARVPIYKPGVVVNFHLGSFDMPIVSARVAQEFQTLAKQDVELFEVQVGSLADRFFILNVVALSDCIDERRSEFTRWKDGDGQPERVGQFHSISKIRVDVARTHPHHAFRIENWRLALLVSDTLRDRLIRIPQLGVKFERAS